jgi:hypothetical protein
MKSMVAFMIALGLVLALGAAPTRGQTLSLIDDDLPPSVDVIDDASWRARARDHEWKVTMLPERQAFAVEEALSKLWNEYDARIYWRIRTDIDPVSFIPNCWISIFNLDFIAGAWDGNFLATVPGELFCDGLALQLPNYIIGLCGVGDGTLWTDWGRIQSNYANAVAHGLSTYYPDYYKKALAVIGKQMPTALNWGLVPNLALPGTPTGIALQPIFGPPRPQMYAELAQRAQNVDVRGGAYIMQNYPLNLLPRQLAKEVLRWLPDDKIEPSLQGLEKIEDLKRDLAKREGIFDRALQWATWDLVGLGGAKPRGDTGAATPTEMAGVGQQIFFNVQSRFITEVSPRIPILWRACFDIWSGATIPFPTPLPPVIHAVPRFEAYWNSIPEGRRILEAKGKPLGYAVTFAALNTTR